MFKLILPKKHSNQNVEILSSRNRYFLIKKKNSDSEFGLIGAFKCKKPVKQKL